MPRYATQCAAVRSTAAPRDCPHNTLCRSDDNDTIRRGLLDQDLAFEQEWCVIVAPRA
jgi:hypothetical protein